MSLELHVADDWQKTVYEYLVTLHDALFEGAQMTPRMFDRMAAELLRLADQADRWAPFVESGDEHDGLPA